MRFFWCFYHYGLWLPLTSCLIFCPVSTSIPRHSKLRGSGSKSRPGRIFVVEVVHIQCAKLYKGLECIVLSMVLCTMKNHFKSFDKSRPQSRSWASFCRDFSMMVQNATLSNIHSLTIIKALAQCILFPGFFTQYCDIDIINTGNNSLIFLNSLILIKIKIIII